MMFSWRLMSRVGPLMAVSLLAAQAVVAQPPLSADSAEVIAELSKRSQIAEADLRPILADCEKTQMSMNLCAFQQAVWAELLLDAAIAEKAAMTPQAYADWKDALHARCLTETEESAGGSMRAMMVSACKETVMLAERRLILGEENFPAPPKTPQHP